MAGEQERHPGRDSPQVRRVARDESGARAPRAAAVSRPRACRRLLRQLRARRALQPVPPEGERPSPRPPARPPALRPPPPRPPFDAARGAVGTAAGAGVGCSRCGSLRAGVGARGRPRLVALRLHMHQLGTFAGIHPPPCAPAERAAHAPWAPRGTEWAAAGARRPSPLTPRAAPAASRPLRPLEALPPHAPPPALLAPLQAPLRRGPRAPTPRRGRRHGAARARRLAPTGGHRRHSRGGAPRGARRRGCRRAAGQPDEARPPRPRPRVHAAAHPSTTRPESCRVLSEIRQPACAAHHV